MCPCPPPPRVRSKSAQSADPPTDTLDDLFSVVLEGEYFGQLLETSAASNKATAKAGEFIEEVGAVIARDVSRTFPANPRFQSAEGRESLRRVLHAYAVHDPAVGYCQVRAGRVAVGGGGGCLWGGWGRCFFARRGAAGARR